MFHERSVWVVVPAFREARLIARTLRSVPAWVDGICVVDDASPDATSTAARSVPDSRVVVMRHGANQGVGAAIATGTLRAIRSGADVVAVMAADGQMDPEDLRAVVEPVATGRADYVKGNRFLHARRREMPAARRVAGRVLARATRLATGLTIDDSQCGYTAISSDAARAIRLDALWPRYGYPNDLLAMLAHAGLRVTEVPVRPVYEDEESGIRAWHFGVVLWVIVRRYVLQRTAVPRARYTSPGTGAEGSKRQLIDR